mmetsp:Transcript_22799/g.28045  ORF Transcript_22799/g.28045 Transcript_22799/m.28045 type:complete len:224 (+) Transcript_22799:129-800(+)
MSMKYVGARDGIDYYKKHNEYFTRHAVRDEHSLEIKYVYRPAPGGCFEDEGVLIKLDEGKQVKSFVKDINIGDMVLTSKGFKKVIYIHAPNSNIKLPVLTIMCHNNVTLSLTPTHLLYNNNNELMEAKNAKIGDELTTLHGKAKIKSINETFKSCRSIVTSNGELIVNDIKVSSFAGTKELGMLLNKCIGIYSFLSFFNIYACKNKYIQSFNNFAYMKLLKKY